METVNCAINSATTPYSGNAPPSRGVNGTTLPRGLTGAIQKQNRFGILDDGGAKRVKSMINTSAGSSTSYFVGGYYELTDGAVTKYYYAGSQRIAMRQNGTLRYLLGDHLGSTSLVTDANGNNPIVTMYKAWGEVRYLSASLPTRYTYTGQYSDSYINLLWYGSRHYDPALGRFIQPDSIVPLASQGVQAWDRYAYANNAPTRYTDPTGHMIDDGCNTSGCGEWKPKSNVDKRNWAFTVMFLGSGKDGKWTNADWNFYLENYQDLWGGRTQWQNSDDVTGWDLFALHTERLASKYDSNQGAQFVRDFALVFAGMSATVPWYETAWNAQDGNGEYPYLNEGNEGLQDQYQDDNHPGENASHHYAGFFFLGYYGTAPGGIVVNLGRDADIWNHGPGQGLNPGDVLLGNVAALDGARFVGNPRMNPPSPMEVADWISELSE